MLAATPKWVLRECRRQIITPKTRNMKEVIKLLVDDISMEHFTRKETVVYGVLYPLGVMALCVIVTALELC